MPTKDWKKEMTGSGKPTDRGARWLLWQYLESFTICGQRSGQDLRVRVME